MTTISSRRRLNSINIIKNRAAALGDEPFRRRVSHGNVKLLCARAGGRAGACRAHKNKNLDQIIKDLKKLDINWRGYNLIKSSSNYPALQQSISGIYSIANKLFAGFLLRFLRYLPDFYFLTTSCPTSGPWRTILATIPLLP